ncbi:MAG: hypothetical protein U0841_29295 [Chloroflexia bacterium]
MSAASRSLLPGAMPLPTRVFRRPRIVGGRRPGRARPRNRQRVAAFGEMLAQRPHHQPFHAIGQPPGGPEGDQHHAQVLLDRHAGCWEERVEPERDASADGEDQHVLETG